MMSSLLLAIVTLLSVAAMPHTAHAYLEPDDVLYDDDFSLRFFDPPPSARETQAIAEQQRLNSARRREEAQAALLAEQEAEKEETHAAAPEEGGEEEADAGELEALLEALQRLQEEQDGGANAAGTTTAEEDRLLERLRDREEQEAREAWLHSFGGETLHSGAPLTDTGPATVILTLVVAGAIGETWRRVRKM